MKGWVYVLTNREMPGLAKIGYSTRDPATRAEELARGTTGLPRPFTLSYEALVNDPSLVEKEVHSILEEYRKEFQDSRSREWFRISLEKAIQTIKSVANEILREDINPDIDEQDEISYDEYLRAAEQGDAKAQTMLGSMYEKGQGISKDYQEAFKWYLKAAEQNDAEAQFRLGSMYEDDRGVAQNDKEAFKWYLKAAKQGDADAKDKIFKIIKEQSGFLAALKYRLSGKV